MDFNPPDNVQLPTPTIQLKSSDGEIFQVEVKAAKLSSYIKEMLDDLGVEENEVIPIPQNAPKISGAVLGKIIQWANHHKDDPPAAEDDEKKVKPTDDISSWDTEFLQVVDQSTLFQIIRAADYLNIKGLLELTCKTVATMIRGTCPSEIHQKFNIQNDFSEAERMQVQGEIVWCERPDYEENDRRSGNGTVGDQTHAGFIQNMNQGDDQVVQDCFRNSIILRKLFEHFTTHELLYTHQFVNKLWNYESRIVIRQRGNVHARLSCGCTGKYDDDLESFANHLQQMNFIPYSGLSIVTHRKAHTAGLCAALDATLEAILDWLPLRHISVKLGDDWQNSENCPTLRLLKKIFQDYGGVVEELELDICQQRVEFSERFVRDCSFPGLKVLKLKENACYFTVRSMDYTTYMKTLVSHAPNLKELHTTGPISLFENVLEGREAVLVYSHEVQAPFEPISKRVIRGLRLKRMELKYPDPDFDFGRFNTITPMLLQASSKTLCSMNIDAVFAVSLMCYGIPLQNLKYLTMYINYGQLERVCPQILRIVKNFDFSHLFPNVKKVDILPTNRELELSVDHLTTIIEQADAVLREPVPNRAANVKKLGIWHSNLSNAAASYHAELLPNIEKLYVNAFAEQPITFGLIWKTWGNLTELEVRGNILPNVGNLDSVFCGIFPEEVAELRQKDEAYLKAVNIVPVMPAMTGLKNLKTLKITYEGRRDEQLVDDETFMFSKATALLAFAKFPNLAVSLYITSYAPPPAMTYLKPYVSIKSYVKEPGD